MKLDTVVTITVVIKFSYCGRIKNTQLYGCIDKTLALCINMYKQSLSSSLHVGFCITLFVEDVLMS